MKDFLYGAAALAALVGAIVLFFWAAGHGLTWLSTYHGRFHIEANGQSIDAIRITNFGDGRIYYLKADGTGGVVSGSFTLSDMPAVVEAKP